MKDDRDNGDVPSPASGEPVADERPAAGGAPASADEVPHAAGAAPLGDWRGPLFWMACGALVAGLVGGAVVLAQRVGVERDMAAVATTLPPPTGLPDAALESAARFEARAPVRATEAAPPRAIEAASARTVPPSPGAQAGSASPPAAAAKPPAPHKLAVPAHGASPRTVEHRPPSGAALAKRKEAKRAPASRSQIQTRQGRRRLDPKLEALYAEVFKRCPRPGEAGSVECRRHICNGAEGKGLACKPYRTRLR